MRFPSRTTCDVHAAPFSTTAPFSFRTSSTNHGVLGPVPPPSSSSLVKTVRRRPAQRERAVVVRGAQQGGRAVAEGGNDLAGRVDGGPADGRGLRPGRGPSSARGHLASRRRRRRKRRRRPAPAGWTARRRGIRCSGGSCPPGSRPPADSAARLTSSTVGFRPPGVAMCTVWPAPSRVWWETTSSSAQYPVGCSLPSRIVRESAAETTIRILAMVLLLFCRQGRRTVDQVKCGKWRR